MTDKVGEDNDKVIPGPLSASERSKTDLPKGNMAGRMSGNVSLSVIAFVTSRMYAIVTGNTFNMCFSRV